MLSIAPGYDPRYLTSQVGSGAENYYLAAVAEHGEPPGRWWGPGAAELGLEPGSEIDARVMEELYSTFHDPRDPNFLNAEVPDEEKARLGRRPPTYDKAKAKAFAKKLAKEPDATPERRKALWREVLAEVPQAVMHHDATFSPTKSVTLLHAGLQAAARAAREAGNVEQAEAFEEAAEKVWGAVDAGAAASLQYLMEHAGTARRGFHGKVIDGRSTGKWIEAGNWVVARFRQHTNRDGEPQLHIHQAILNRQKGADGEWSGLSGKAIYRVKPAAGAYGERVMYEQLVRELGVELRARPDGHGYEIVGVTPEQIAAFSMRRTKITQELKKQIEIYVEKHGRAPSARALFLMAQDVTLGTKAKKQKLKDAPSREEQLEEWEKRTTEKEVGLLRGIPARALGRFTGRTAEKARQKLAELDYQRVLTAAVADAQAAKSEFTRYEVIRHINRHLPEYMGGLPAERLEALLEELADAALDPAGPAKARLLNTPDVVEIPEELQRADGTSVYQAPRWERYTTAAQLDVETQLTNSAVAAGAPGLEPEVALAALRERCSAESWEALRREAGEAADRLEPEQAEQPALDGEAVPAVATPAAATETGPDVAAPGAPLVTGAGAASNERRLLEDQAAASYGILTSRRNVDVLVGPAGTGKSYVVSQLAAVWKQTTGTPVLGLTTAQNAAYVLAGEGMDDTWNITRWLDRIDRGKVQLTPGQLIVVDEAGMVPTKHLARIQELADAAGAKVIWSGDPAQLAAPEAGGMMRHLVEVGGAYELTDVRRFSAEWEGPASLQLRQGVESVLDEYDAHGRLLEDEREEAENEALQAYLADYLDGKQSLLLAPTNAQAADLAGRVRARLVELERVSPDGVTLYDESGQPVNTAGVGDMIVARHNDRKVTIGETARELSNRDVFRVVGIDADGSVRAVLLDKNGKLTGHETLLPRQYVRKYVELAYAGTVHSAQGRTVHRSLAVVDDSVTRQMFYVMMTRGKNGNYAFVVRDPARVADLRPGPEQAAERTAALVGEAVPLDPKAAAASPEQREKFAVLRGVLERSEESETAIEAALAEAQRPTHMGHLGGMWINEIRERTADAYINAAEARGALTASDAALLRSDEAKSSLGRLLRQLEMSGRNAAQIFDEAIRERELDSAESLAKTLHWRITTAGAERGLEVKTLEPSEETIAATWKARTPTTGNPRIDRFLGEIGLQLDVRTHMLGQEALERTPDWMAERMGQAPVGDDVERGEWAARAGTVLGYRELYGVVDEADPLGPEPSRQSPEQRAAWFAAHDALTGKKPGEVSRTSIGALWKTRAEYERELKWAPPYVAEELQRVSIEARERAEEAVRLRAQAAAAADPTERAALEYRAAGQQTLATALQQRQAVLEEVHAARRTWYESTRDLRTAALRADAELRRRDGVDADRLNRLHGDHEADVQREQEEAERQRAEADQPIPGQLTIDGWAPHEVPTPPEPEPEQERPAPAAEREVDVEEVVYTRYAMYRDAGEREMTPFAIADALGTEDIVEAMHAQERMRARYEHEKARQAEPVPTVEQPEPQDRPVEPEPQKHQEEEPEYVEQDVQMALDLFGAGEGSPAAEEELTEAVERARAARQVLRGRAVEEQAAEEERIRRQAVKPGERQKADVERQQERVAETRRDLERRERSRSRGPADPELAEAVRLATEATNVRHALREAAKRRQNKRPQREQEEQPHIHRPTQGPDHGPSLGL